MPTNVERGENDRKCHCQVSLFLLAFGYITLEDFYWKTINVFNLIVEEYVLTLHALTLSKLQSWLLW